MRKRYTDDSLFDEEDEEITLGKEWNEESGEAMEQPPQDKGKLIIAAAVAAAIILIAAGAFFALSALSNNNPSNNDTAGQSQPALTAGAKPSLLSISITEAPTTNREEITLSLYAKNAAECRFSGDGISWSEWRAYSNEAKWRLEGSDGEKTVYYQCRNAAGNSASVSTKIYLDRTAPVASLSAAVQGNLAMIDAEGSDENPYGAACVLIVDGKETDRFFGKISRKFVLDSGTHALLLNCSDAAGNSATAKKALEIGGNENATAEAPEQSKKINILINNGAATTNSRYVTLSLYAAGGHLCRYRENNGQWTNYEPYTITRAWTIVAAYSQTVTIYYECKDKNGTLIGQASDSIEYVNEAAGGGSSSGGGSSGGGSGGSQTLRLKSVTLAPLAGYSLKTGFTSNYMVDLSINAVGAKECRYRNIPWEPNPVWTGWTAYRASQTIEMLGDRGGDGDRLVEVECRDAKNNTVAGSARITYDHTAPSEVDTSRPEDMTLIYSEEINGTNHTYVMLVWLPSSDATSGVYSYNIDKMNVSEGRIVTNYRIVRENGSNFYQFIDELDPTETYIYAFTTYDNANNAATSTRLLNCDPSQPLPANCN